MYDGTPRAQASRGDQHAGAPPEAALWWRRLLHRWFVEYNPTYLLSATLVLLGMILASRGITQEWTLAGQLGVAAVAEAYAFALIGGAALLTRLRLPRPAVILGLLAVLYQGDLTLHTETSAFLSRFGALASFLWVVIFVAKLETLAWALKLKLSPSAIIVPSLGAIGFAVMPHLLRETTWGYHRTLMVMWWVFALFSAAFWTSRRVDSPDLRGPAGLRARRALRASWAIWAVLAAAHVLFWIVKFPLIASFLLPVGMLLATRWIRHELGVWCAIGATLLFTYSEMRDALPVIALMSAVTLVLHALRRPEYRRLMAEPPAQTPYRTPASADAPAASETEISFSRAETTVMARLLTGAMFAGYLALWSANWAGNAEPMMAVYVLLTVAVAVLVWRVRASAAILPLAGTWLHFGAHVGVVTAPITMLQWGVSLVGGGFALLALSLAVTLHLRKRSDPIG